MALELENFKEVDSPGNSRQGGQVYSIFSETDTLDVMAAPGYLNGLAPNLHARDLLLISGSDSGALHRVSSVTLTTVATDPTSADTEIVTQSLTGPGAITPTATAVFWTTSGADNGTLASGSLAGHVITIILVFDGGNGTVVIAEKLSGVDPVLADKGDSVTLMWTGTAWAIIGSQGI